MLQALDPQIDAVLGSLGAVPMSAETLPSYRGASPQTAPPDGLSRFEQVVPGEQSVRLRIHRPQQASGLRPCVYSMHGGGYVLGDAAMDDVRFGSWCLELGIVGVSVDYRLAPEVPYPGPLQDCYLGLEWVFDHAAEIGVDGGKIGVAGLSAGGGLAAALALKARDEGRIPLACQLLDCPMLDDRQVTPSSRLADLPVWSRESTTFGWRSYLGSLYGSADVPYLAAPARCEDLSGLPPALVSVGTVDGFRDEDIEYAMRLNQAGVPCELHVYPGACHAYQMVTESAPARRADRDIKEWLAQYLTA